MAANQLTALDYFELFIGFDAFVLAMSNLILVVYRKVYKIWSTATIMVSCSGLLLCRTVTLFFYALAQEPDQPKSFLLINALIGDVPCFFVLNVTLPFLWQWWKIILILKDPDRGNRTEEHNSHIRVLVALQAIILGVFIVDIFLLVAHYRYGLLFERQEMEGYLIVDQKWAIFRAIARSIIMLIQVVFLVTGFYIFVEVVKVVR